MRQSTHASERARGAEPGSNDRADDLLPSTALRGQAEPAVGQASAVLLLPDRVFDGETFHDAWAVLMEGERIAAAEGR